MVKRGAILQPLSLGLVLAVGAGIVWAAAVLWCLMVTEQVWRVAVAGVTMPQKSTYFYPKLLTGLVMNPLVD